jgi:formate hydrogenlyase subunit 3/multisubunit Na+/H+ antiporter MnhD subunit
MRNLMPATRRVVVYAIQSMTTPGGLLLVLTVLVPSLGVLAGLVLGSRSARRVALVTLPLGLGIAIAIADDLLRSGDAVVYFLGGWAPPLGVALRADGLSAIMLPATAVVICGIDARHDFDTPPGAKGARAPLVFWTLLLAVWGSLNLIFVSGDLFTLYVALELLTFAAVPLVCLDGRGETLRSALRYLLFALLGSVFYLLGAVLLYGGYRRHPAARIAAPKSIATAKRAGGIPQARPWGGSSSRWSAQRNASHSLPLSRRWPIMHLGTIASLPPNIVWSREPTARIWAS